MHVDVFIATILKNSLGLLLIVACLGKTKGFGVFKVNLIESFNVPPTLSTSLTLLIILSELALGMSLLFGTASLVELALYATFLLFLLFSIVVGQKLITYQSVSCNCFGVTKENITFVDLLRNLVLLVFCVIAASYYQPLSLNLWDISAAGLTTIVCVICLLNFKDIVKTLFFAGY